MKLNLGVGPLPIHQQHLQVMGNVDEWTLVDLYVHDPKIKNWDATTLSEVPDGSCETIYASHLLEHIPHPQVHDVLAVWQRKLKSGGELIINVPDLAWAARQVLKFEAEQMLAGYYSDFEGNNGLQSIIYGTHAHDGERHQSGYTRRSLTEWLEGMGFTDIDVAPWYDAHDMGVLLAICKKK